MPDSSEPEILTLDEEEQVTLTGLLLHLWSRDLETVENWPECRRARSAYRNKLRFLRRETTPDGGADHDPLDIETPKVLASRLKKLDSEADALQLLVSACASQPWESLDEPFNGRLNKEVRAKVLGWAAKKMPGGMHEGTVAEIDSIISPTVAQKTWKTLRNPKVLAAAGIGSIAIAATAGVAAPAIGAAIGGTMGLSGAAAASAGLASLGGGAIAGGGFGMAGGTAVLGALGASGGAGLGAAFGAAKYRNSFAAQSAQLIALVNVGQDLSANTARRCHDQARILEVELGRLIEKRALSRRKATTEKLTGEIQQLRRLREQMLPRIEFD